MATKMQEQTAIDERVFDSNELERALEEREKHNNSLKAVRNAFKEADEKCKTMLHEFQLAVGEVGRCGRFRIEHKQVAPREVAWETPASSRLTIRADD